MVPLFGGGILSVHLSVTWPSTVTPADFPTATPRLIISGKARLPRIYEGASPDMLVGGITSDEPSISQKARLPLSRELRSGGPSAYSVTEPPTEKGWGLTGFVPVSPVWPSALRLSYRPPTLIAYHK